MRRNVSGQGARIDCSMLGSLLDVAALQTSEYFGTGQAARRIGSAHPRNAPYRAFRAKDDYFVIAAGNDKLWRSVCEAVGAIELVDDDRFRTQHLRARNQDELLAILEPLFGRRTAAEWLEEMDRRGVPCAPINDYARILSDQHVAAMGWIHSLTLPNGVRTRTIGYPIGLSGYAFDVFLPPPKLGEHTEDVFKDWLGSSGAEAA